MAFKDDLSSGVDDGLKAVWNVRDGQAVPKSDDVTLKNGAVSGGAWWCQSW